MGKERASSSGLQPGTPSDPVPFGKYYFMGLIARGGMAEVYRARARDARDGESLLAIKVMRPTLAREPRFVDMFQREGKLATLLRNPCIVRTLDVGKHQGHNYIAMEYIGGCDLSKVLRRCQSHEYRMPIPHCIYIAKRVAEGLNFAHELTDGAGRPLSLVNRDVSPSNVRLSYDGDVKMLDFGIAQALTKFTSEIGVLKGKFSYMSPEQIRGMPLDARSDIFAAGILLHEMLTSEKLFRGDTEFALMEKVRKAEVPPPSAFNRRVPGALDAIVAKALQRDVGDRYQSAAELADALGAVLDGYGFKAAELRQFMRRLFRAEYAQELEIMEQARSSLPMDERLRVAEAAASAAAAAAVGAEAPLPSAAPLPSPLPEGVTPVPDLRGGLWSRLKRRFKR
jgi:serine/threonine protein kinase